jgi:hypothetical protein
VQEFIDALKQLRNNEYVRLRLLDLFNREKIITLEPNEHYWPTAKIFWDGSQWRYQASLVSSKAGKDDG